MVRMTTNMKEITREEAKAREMTMSSFVWYAIMQLRENKIAKNGPKGKG